MRLDAEDSLRQEFINVVEDIDNQENSGGRQGKRRRRFGEVEGATVEHGVEARTKLGVFWPEKIYMKSINEGGAGKKIAKRDVYWHEGADGKMVKGIVRPPSFGCPRWMHRASMVFSIKILISLPTPGQTLAF